MRGANATSVLCWTKKYVFKRLSGQFDELKIRRIWRRPNYSSPPTSSDIGRFERWSHKLEPDFNYSPTHFDRPERRIVILLYHRIAVSPSSFLLYHHMKCLVGLKDTPIPVQLLKLSIIGSGLLRRYIKMLVVWALLWAEGHLYNSDPVSCTPRRWSYLPKYFINFSNM